MAQQRIGGFLVFKIDGVQYSARGAFKYQPLTTEKTGRAGQDGPHGFTEMPVVPYIEGELTDLGGVSVQALQALDDSTFTLELANGKVVILRNGWVSGQIPVDTTEGKYPIKLEGKNCYEDIGA